MQLYQWNRIPVENMTPLISRQVIHGTTLTIARLVLKKGAIVPRHSHLNEQVSTVESGTLRFFFDDTETTVTAGESLVIPPHVPHRVEATEDCVATDVFSPVREDWIRGDDAYLRG